MTHAQYTAYPMTHAQHTAYPPARAPAPQPLHGLIRLIDACTANDGSTHAHTRTHTHTHRSRCMSSSTTVPRPSPAPPPAKGKPAGASAGLLATCASVLSASRRRCVTSSNCRSASPLSAWACSACSLVIAAIWPSDCSRNSARRRSSCAACVRVCVRTCVRACACVRVCARVGGQREKKHIHLRHIAETKVVALPMTARRASTSLQARHVCMPYIWMQQRGCLPILLSLALSFYTCKHACL